MFGIRLDTAKVSGMFVVNLMILSGNVGGLGGGGNGAQAVYDRNVLPVTDTNDLVGFI